MLTQISIANVRGISKIVFANYTARILQNIIANKDRIRQVKSYPRVTLGVREAICPISEGVLVE